MKFSQTLVVHCDMSIFYPLFLLLSSYLHISKGYRPIEVELWDYFIEKCAINEAFKPYSNDNTPVIHVKVVFDLWRFYEIVDRTETMSLLGSLNMKWNHPCVKWDQNGTYRWKNLKFLTLSLDSFHVWLPKVQHINSKLNSGGLVQSPGTVLDISRNGIFTWYVTKVFISNCAMGNSLNCFSFMTFFCYFQNR